MRVPLHLVLLFSAPVLSVVSLAALTGWASVLCDRKTFLSLTPHFALHHVSTFRLRTSHLSLSSCEVVLKVKEHPIESRVDRG